MRPNALPLLHLLLAFILLPSTAGVATILVKADGTGDYATIQAAIDAASAGDEVVLAPGTYTGDGNHDLDYHGKAITVRGSDPTNPAVVAATIINCQGTQAAPHRGFAFRSGEGPDSILAGLTIQNGFAPFETIDGVTDSLGGGIFCNGAGPTIRYCVLRYNTTGIYGPPNVTANGGPGGAIYARESILVLEYCTITGNATAWGRGFSSGTARAGDGGHGAGIYCASSSLAIRHCAITGNAAGAGGGNDTSAAPEPRNGKGGNGGGIYAVSGSVQITDSTIAGNSAGRGGSETRTNYGASGKGGDGGGIYCSGASLELASCAVTGNTAGGGGGILGTGQGGPGGHGGGVYCDSAIIRNCLLANNTAGWGGFAEFGGRPPGGNGGGLYCNAGQVLVESCTFAYDKAGKGGGGNSSGGVGGNGGGLYATSAAFPIISNCLFANNAAGEGGRTSNNYLLGGCRRPGTGGHGGGVFCAGGSLSWSCFANNAAGDGADAPHGEEDCGGADGGNGGAVYGISADYCTFANNRAGLGGKGRNGGPDGSPGTGDDLYNGTATDCDFILTGGAPYDVGFVDADGPDNKAATWQDNNYHLTANSLCINAGDPAYVPLAGETDLDGQPRVMGGAVDLGADEWTWPGDVNGDTHVGSQDLLLLVAAFGSSFPQPAYAATCDFNADGLVDVADLLDLVANWGK